MKVLKWEIESTDFGRYLPYFLGDKYKTLFSFIFFVQIFPVQHIDNHSNRWVVNKAIIPDVLLAVYSAPSNCENMIKIRRD